MTKEEVERFEWELVNSMPKLPNRDKIMEADENDFNNDIEKQIKNLTSIMWKGLVFLVIVFITATLIWLIVHK